MVASEEMEFQLLSARLWLWLRRHSRFIATIYNNVFSEGYAEEIGTVKVIYYLDKRTVKCFEFTVLIIGDEFYSMWINFYKVFYQVL